MKTYAQIQQDLEKLLRLPKNLPVVYLLGDTGAGKTCLVRQLLGTTAEKFPSVKRVRTTVAPTEFIITTEPSYRAAFVMRSEREIARLVAETLEQAVTTAFAAVRANDEPPDLADVLGDSPDQRFRLRCFLDEQARKEIGLEISGQVVPKIVGWAKANFPDDKDDSTVLELAIETEFAPELDAIANRVIETIVKQVKAACETAAGGQFPETFSFETADRAGFIQRLKKFLSVEEGSISPAIEKARVRGKLRSEILPPNMELVVIDGEGIGHDARETRVLSARHFDYFYSSDAIILVEDSETPFRAGGKSALAAIAKHGYLSKTSLAFSRLDLVQGEADRREDQIREVERALRNVLHALKDESINIERQRLDVRFLGKMHESVPDSETHEEIRRLFLLIQQRHGAARARFIAPHYDYELLAGFLAQATAALRRSWAGHIRGDWGVKAAPWQTQKAFTFRMSWKLDEYRYLKPVAEFADHLVSNLSSFISHPIGWAEDITESHRNECLQQLKRELSNELINFVRQEVVADPNPNWVAAADKRGDGSTFVRKRLIMEIIESSAPDLTGEGARAFKNAVKALVESAILRCST